MDPAKQPQAPRLAGSGVLMSIQAARGIATFVVIVAHIQLYVAGKMNLPDLLPFNGVVGAAVDSFFVVSGFIMVYASERLFGQPGGMRIFFLRRLARILPMYWVTTTFVVIYLIATYGSLDAAGAPFSYVVASYLFIPIARPDGYGTPVHGVAWTLNYEVFFYMLFGCFVFLSRRRIVIVLSTIFIALVLIALAFGPLPNPLAYWSYALILDSRSAWFWRCSIATACASGPARTGRCSRSRPPSWPGRRGVATSSRRARTSACSSGASRPS